MSIQRNSVRDHIESNPQAAKEDIAILASLAKKMSMNGKGLNCTLTPYLMSTKNYETIRQQSETLLSTLNNIVSLYQTDKKIRSFFSHLEAYEIFLSLPLLSEQIIAFARFDLIEAADGQFKVIEPNTCCPGGHTFIPNFYRGFRQTSVYQHLQRGTALLENPLLTGHAVFPPLIREYEQHFGSKERYAAMIADTKAAPMDNELHILAESGRSQGLWCQKAAIQDLSYYNDALHLGEQRLDIIYLFLDVLFKGRYAQVTNSLDDISDFLCGAMRKSCLIVNPFPSIFISEDKSILALLHDSAFQEYFSEHERRVIHALVPPTYRMRDSTIQFQGESHNLLSLLRARKDNFLIKAQMESMGRDIVIGQGVSAQQWEERIENTLNGPYIAQEFIPAKKQLTFDPTSASFDEVNTVSAIWMTYGKAQGMLNRITPSLVANGARDAMVQLVIPYT